MIWWTGLAPWEFESSSPGGLGNTYLVQNPSHKPSGLKMLGFGLVPGRGRGELQPPRPSEAFDRVDDTCLVSSSSHKKGVFGVVWQKSTAQQIRQLISHSYSCKESSDGLEWKWTFAKRL